MNVQAASRAIARKPQQRRGFDRFEQVLHQAERLLLEGGVEAVSIPVLAERIGCTRTSVYQFFPTHYAILNTLAERHLAALEDALVERVGDLRNAENWREVTTLVVRAAAHYYLEHPIACHLLLNGPISSSSYRAMEITISRLGGLTRQIFEQRGIAVPQGDPDAAALAVEFGTAAFRMSYFLHGTITPEYTRAAETVMLAYLAAQLGVD